MREIVWIWLVVIFCTEARSIISGTNEHTSVKSNASSSELYGKYDKLRAAFDRYEDYNLGSEVNLTCSNKTWTETIYVIWKIQMKNKNCTISSSDQGESKNTCGDGKSLRNTSSAQSYLHIPELSPDDVGVFTCELVYTGGNDNYNVHVAVTFPPVIEAWLEHKDNKMVAVCKVEGGHAAANVSWIYTGSTPAAMETSLCTEMPCECRLELPEGMAAENLSCSVSHPFWKQEKTVKPELKKAFFWLWPWILVAVGSLAVLAGIVFFAQKKIIMLRQGRQSDSSSKLPKTEDVEEVEPYASYVQRVNSIYNT